MTVSSTYSIQSVHCLICRQAESSFSVTSSKTACGITILPYTFWRKSSLPILRSAISGVELTIAPSILHFLQNPSYQRSRHNTLSKAILCLIAQRYRLPDKGQRLFLRHPRIVKHLIPYLYRQFTHSFHLPLQPTFSAIVPGPSSTGYQRKNVESPENLRFSGLLISGEGGIRTLETLLTPTRFPVVRPRPS